MPGLNCVQDQWLCSYGIILGEVVVVVVISDYSGCLHTLSRSWSACQEAGQLVS